MRRLLIHSALLLSVLAGSAGATAQLMTKLPNSSQFRCLNCHTNQDPTTANATLNRFGEAFRDNSFHWDTTLALQSSDGDACSNGFELGDDNGDGIPNTNVTHERSNPGQPDCTLEITPQAWTALKKLFR